MQILPMGLAAVLVEDPSGGPAAWSRGLGAMHLDGIVDIVPAAATVLVRFATPAALGAAVGRLAAVEPAHETGGTDPVVIPVRYDGPDLEAVAESTGLAADELVALHSGADYRVAFCGFAPGFGYLAGLPDRLHLPRRASPRTRVPAGSVAIAAAYAAVYPGASPGGWHLLGMTDVVLFDPDREPPSLLGPGTPVRFEPT